MLELRRYDPDGEEFGPDAYVFGNEVGEGLTNYQKAWSTLRLRAIGHGPHWGLHGRFLPCCREQLARLNLHMHDLRREAGSLDGFMNEVTSAGAVNAAHVSFLADLHVELSRDVEEGDARGLVTRMALALQVSEMVRHSPADVVERFIDSRLARRHAGVIGTLAAGADLAGIVERASVVR